MIALPLTHIRTDGGTQPRAQLDFAVIADYAEAMAEGMTFPPVVVFHDGTSYWLADGFHRLHAVRQIGVTEIAADVRQGTIQDAQWHSYSVNQAHGLQRTNKDKRRAVDAALQHPYASRYSDRDIANHCGVSNRFVGNLRHETETTVNGSQSDVPRLVSRNGITYEMNTANIGQRPTDPIPFDLEVELAEEALTPYELEIAAQRQKAEWRARFLRDNEELGLENVLDEATGELIDIRPTRDQHIMQVMGSSESPEWYTPTYIVDLVLSLFEVISVDPCSNSHETPTVPAKTLWTKEDDGLSQPWHGNVYMNPPYGDEIGPWVERMVNLYRTHEIDQAIALLPGRIDTIWFQPLYDYPICNVRGRVKFQNADNSAPFPSVVVYLGADEQGFIDVFRQLGPIMKRIA